MPAMTPKLGISRLRLGEVVNFVALGLRAHWLVSLALAAIVVAACVAVGVGQKAESWTASSTISIGMIPTVDGILNLPGPRVEPVELARTLVVRINSVQFQREVSAENLRGSSAALFLRGVAVDDSTIRLEANAASKQAALALLQQGILGIQRAHHELSEPRMELLRTSRDSLRNALGLLNSLRKNSSDLAQVPEKAMPQELVASSSSHDQLDKIVEFETRVAVLNYVERIVSPTGPQGGFQPSVDGPREVNLMRIALLSGLGVLFVAIILTLSRNVMARRS